jgi:hypothetical protein
VRQPRKRRSQLKCVADGRLDGQRGGTESRMRRTDIMLPSDRFSSADLQPRGAPASRTSRGLARGARIPHEPRMTGIAGRGTTGEELAIDRVHVLVFQHRIDQRVDLDHLGERGAGGFEQFAQVGQDLPPPCRAPARRSSGRSPSYRTERRSRPRQPVDPRHHHDQVLRDEPSASRPPRKAKKSGPPQPPITRIIGARRPRHPMLAQGVLIVEPRGDFTAHNAVARAHRG